MTGNIFVELGYEEKEAEKLHDLAEVAVKMREIQIKHSMPTSMVSEEVVKLYGILMRQS